MITRADLNNIGVTYTGRWATEIKTPCPKCSSGRKKPKEPCLAINTKDGMYLCHHCGWSGSIGKENDKIVYNKPVHTDNNTKLSDKMLKYFNSRGISDETVNRNKITQSLEYMPGSDGKKNVINFNYYRNGELVNIKYRDASKTFKQTKDAEKIFYGLDDIKGESDIIIVEGEFDKLAFEEAGYKNCISVPDGAPNATAKNLDNKFTYIDNCFDYLDAARNVYIGVDNDENGIRLLQEMSRRIGREKCFIIDFPDGCKDANDVLQSYGPELLDECFQNARAYPVEGVFGLEDVRDEMLDVFDNGKKKGLTTGYPELNPHYSFRLSEFDVFTGIPGHGKTSFALQLMMNASILYGWKWGVFSPENYPINELFDGLVELYIGKTSDMDSPSRMTKEEYVHGMNFLKNHFYAVYPEKDFTMKSVLERFQFLVRRKGIKGVLVDPFNQLDHDFGSKSEANYIADALNRIRRFTKSHDLKFIVVAHPITMRSATAGSGDNEVPTAYRIAGGANWFNKADNIICVHRPNPKDFTDTTTNIHVQKIKFQKLVGVPTGEPVVLRYHRPSGRFTSFTGEYPIDKYVNQPSEQVEMPWE